MTEKRLGRTLKGNEYLLDLMFIRVKKLKTKPQHSMSVQMFPNK